MVQLQRDLGTDCKGIQGLLSVRKDEGFWTPIFILSVI